MHRWTMKELKEISDRNFIITTLNERRNRLRDPYGPLYVYITKLLGRIEGNESYMIK